MIKKVVKIVISVAIVAGVTKVVINEYNYRETVDNLLITQEDAIIELYKNKNELEDRVKELEESNKEINNEVESLKKEVEKLKKEAYNKQASYKNLGSFNASAYTPYCNGCSGITKTGYDVRKSIYYNGMRIIATDPSVIPLYSIVEISYDDVSFKAISLDVGGAIKGKKIDLLTETKSEAYKFGRKNVNVKLIKSGGSNK